MTRIALMLATETAALAAMVALPIEIPWSNPSALALLPEEVLAAGILRMAALAIVIWLLVSTLLYLAAAPMPRLRHVVGRITAPVVRRVVDTALAATLSLSVATPALASEAPSEPIVVTVEEGSSGSVIIPPGMAVTVPASPGSLDLSSDAAPRTVRSADTLAQPALSEASMFATMVSPQAAAPSTYEVRSGDHLWSIAEAILEQRTGRSSVPDHEIAPFWRSLIEANQDSLRSGNPDLIYPGEVLTIPEVSA